MGRHFGYIKKDDNVEIFLFWLAYIMTRPVGASTGDLLGSSPSEGGWGLGVGWTSLLFFGLIVLIVLYLTYSKIDVISAKADNVSADKEVGGQNKVVPGTKMDQDELL
jgi:uncharacterized membrane-anchored protein